MDGVNIRDVSLSQKELFARAKVLQTKFTAIKPGGETPEMQDIVREVGEIFRRLSELSEKVGGTQHKYVDCVREIYTEIKESHFEIQEQRIRAALLVFMKEPFSLDEKNKKAFTDLYKQINILEQAVTESGVEQKENPRYQALLRSIAADKMFVAEVVSKAQTAQASELLERSKATRGAFPEIEAFSKGKGDEVLAWVKLQEQRVWKRAVSYGPQNKTEETKFCEETVHALLTDPEKVTIVERNGDYYVKLPHTVLFHDKEVDEVKISDLMAKADFSHMEMSQADLEAYASVDSFTFKLDADEEKLLRQINDPKRDPPLSKEEKEALLQLSLLEKRIINNYTKVGSYTVINSLLRGKPSAIFSAMETYIQNIERYIGTLYKSLGEEQKKYQDEVTLHNQKVLKFNQENVAYKALKKDFLARKEQGIATPEEEKTLMEVASRLQNEADLIDKQDVLLKAKHQQIQDLKKLIAVKKEHVASAKASFKADKTKIVKEAFLHAAALNVALSHLPSQSGGFLFRIERNLPESVLREKIQAAKQGEVTVESGFSSTSQIAPSEGFLKQKPSVLILIRNEKAKCISPLSDYDQSENEVLLPPTQVRWIDTESVQAPWGPVQILIGEPVSAADTVHVPMQLLTPEDLPT